MAVIQSEEDRYHGTLTADTGDGWQQGLRKQYV